MSLHGASAKSPLLEIPLRTKSTTMFTSVAMSRRTARNHLDGLASGLCMLGHLSRPVAEVSTARQNARSDSYSESHASHRTTEIR